MSVPYYPPVAISALTRTTTTATATTADTSGMTEGMFLEIYGAYPDAYNGIKSIHIISATQFSYAINNDAAITSPATGTIKYRGASFPYIPIIDRPVNYNTVAYHSQALEDNVVVLTQGRTVTSFYGTTVAASDRYIYVFDSATIPADGDLTANPQLKWQVIKAFAGLNFYIDVPDHGIRFINGVTICISDSGDPTTFAVATDNSYHYDLEYHS